MVGQADTRDLPKRRVRLLRGHRADDRADPALLGRAATQLHEATLFRVPGRPERRCVDFLALRLASLAYELRDRGHVRSEEHTSELQSHSDLHSFPTRRSSDLAIFRSAEFGFFGVIVRTIVQTPRFWGAPRRSSTRRPFFEFQVVRSAGVSTFLPCGLRPLRTSCEIVGTFTPLLVTRTRT